MPLIYSGQEYDLNHRLKFFEKDEIPKTKGKMWPILEKLGKLKNTSSALHGGKKAASYTRINTENDNVLAFKRSKNGVIVTYIGNLSGTKQSIKMTSGKSLDYMANVKLEFKDDIALDLNPWEYKILID